MLRGDFRDTYENFPGTGGPRATRLGPALEAFALDMDAPATLTLQFTDRVLANSSALKASAITLQSAFSAESSSNAVAKVALSPSSTAHAAATLDNVRYPTLQHFLFGEFPTGECSALGITAPPDDRRGLLRGGRPCY